MISGTKGWAMLQTQSVNIQSCGANVVCRPALFEMTYTLKVRD